MRLHIVNGLGVLGYISVLLQWLWVLLTLGYPLAMNESLQKTFLPEQTAKPIEAATLSIPQPIGIMFVVLAVVFAIVISIYVIYSAPRTIGRIGRSMSRTSAETIAPRITRHRHISKKRQARLIERLTWTVKLIAVLLPPLLLMIPTASELGLSYQVVTAVGLYLTIWSIGWFGLQYLLTHVWRISARDIW